MDRLNSFRHIIDSPSIFVKLPIIAIYIAAFSSEVVSEVNLVMKWNKEIVDKASVNRCNAFWGIRVREINTFFIF